MTPTLAVAHLIAATKSSSSSLVTLIPLVAIGLLGYFFFIRPQQRKAQAARQAKTSDFEVGDEVQTVGGVIGTVLEVHGDRYTLLTGALGDDGNLDGPQPTRIVFVRQAIAKKIDPIDDVRVDDEPVQDVRPARSSGNSNGKVNSTSDASDASHDDDIDDVGGDGAASSGDLSGGAEEGGGRRGVSPKSGGRAQRRQRRNLWISVIAVLVIAIGSFAAVFSAKWSPRLGLDLAGGVSVVYTAQGKHVSQADLDETVNILNLRVNGLGVSGAQVQTSGPNQISVSIPGVTDAQQVLDQIGQTARMYFRPVECWAYPQGTPKNSKVKPPTTGTEAIPACTPSLQLTAANLAVTPNSSPQGYSSNNVQPDPQYEAYPSTDVDKTGYATSTVLLPGIGGACDGSTQVRCVLGPAQMTGRSIGSAQATQNQTGQWVVDYSLAGAAGSALWDKVAQANFHEFLGIELDGKVYSAPIIQPTQSTFSSFDGKGEISGSLTQAQAQQLAQAMNFGALPVVLKAATSETVSATLGHSALVAGLGAGIVGLALVLLYALFFYRP